MNAGRTLLVIGLLLFVGGLVYTVAYYLNDGLAGAGPLADLGYANLAAGGGSLCLGVVLAIAGGATMAATRRR